MGIRDIYQFDELYNMGEDLVLAEMELQLGEKGLLGSLSQELVQDMAAFALNLIRPMYRANLIGRVYADAFREEYAAQVKDAVMQAMRRILSHPDGEEDLDGISPEK